MAEDGGITRTRASTGQPTGGRPGHLPRCTGAISTHRVTRSPATLQAIWLCSSSPRAASKIRVNPLASFAGAVMDIRLSTDSYATSQGVL